MPMTLGGGSKIDKGIVKEIQNQYYIQILRNKFNLNEKPNPNKAIFIYHTGNHFETLTLPEYDYTGKGVPLEKIKRKNITNPGSIDLTNGDDPKPVKKYKVPENNKEFHKNKEEYSKLNEVGMLRYGVYMLWWSQYEYYKTNNNQDQVDYMTADSKKNIEFLTRIFHPNVVPDQKSCLDPKYWGGNGVYEMLSMLLGITICVYSRPENDWGIYTPNGRGNSHRPFEIDGSHYMLDKFETKKNDTTLKWGDNVNKPEDGVRLNTKADGNCLYHSIIQALSYKTITIPDLSDSKSNNYDIEEYVILKHCYCA